MSGAFSWIKSSWLALLIGIVVGRFVLTRVV